VKKYSIWIILAVGLLLLAAVLSYPGAFGLTKTEQIVGYKTWGGFALVAELPRGMTSQRGREFLFPDSPILYEDGKPLARPRASGKEISNAGRGRYVISGSNILFSTSDGGPCIGRIFTIRAPLWSLNESLLLAIWLFGLAVAAIAVRRARLSGPEACEGQLQNSWLAYAFTGVSVALVLLFCYAAHAGLAGSIPMASAVESPASGQWEASLSGLVSFISDGFFLGLLFPALWAVLMAANAGQRHAVAWAGLIVLALLPALAGYIYYGVNAASDSSFLVAGVIPCSDARMHFQQAAEIALQGTTQQMFNGRLFYPGFYAVLLKLAGLNLLFANLLVSALVMFGLALTCRAVAKRSGLVGTAIYCLLYWLYFRVYGCGLLMTENLGLLMGVIGFGFLMLSVDREKIWPIFVAILFFALGSAARPGALFILPALALYAGIRVWNQDAGKFRAVASVGAVLLGLAITAGSFGANHVLTKSLCRGEGKAFGNFAFTLHGLLNDTKWSTSANETGWDASRVMEQNIRQIKESPSSLIRGVGRAYGEAYKKRFLFRFGAEKRLASAGMAMFFLALLGCWLWKPLRGDSGWIVLLAAGIIASIPFAPPWDAGERPYAVTVPLQIFLVAAGFALLGDLFRKQAEIFVPVESMGSPASSTEARRQTSETHAASIYSNANSLGLIAFASVCILLVVPAPLLLRFAGASHPDRAFLPGSSLHVSQVDSPRVGASARAKYVDRLSAFQASYPDNARIYLSDSTDFLLGIDWRNLETVLLPWPPTGGL